MEMTKSEFARHFSKAYTDEIKSFAKRAFWGSGDNYLIVKDKENKRRAFCTYCKKWVNIPEDNKHKDSVRCPYCGYSFTVMHVWRNSLYNLENTISLSVWEKSKVEPGAIVMRRIEVWRDFGFTSTRKVPVLDVYMEAERYLFRPGKKALRMKYTRLYGEFTKHSDDWTKHHQTMFIKTVKDRAANSYSFMNPDPLHGWYFMDMDSFVKAIQGTPYQYCAYNLIDLGESYFMMGVSGTFYPERLVQYLDLFSTRPWVEILVKNGLANIVAEKIQGECYAGTINWAGKTIAQAVKRFTRQDLKDIRELNQDYYAKVSSDDLALLLELREHIFSDISLKASLKICNRGTEHTPCSYLSKIRELGSNRLTTLERFRRFFAKQKKINQKLELQDLLYDWLDYLKDLEKLQMDITDPTNLFPKDFYRMHANVSVQVDHQKNKILDDKISTMLPWRKALFTMETEKYLIRPAESTFELINEGKRLHHCVGGYANRYAENDTNILFIREKVQPDVPFVTMEVQKSRGGWRLVQIRGYMNNRNNPLPEEVKKLGDRFMEIVNERAAAQKEKKVRKTA